MEATANFANSDLPTYTSDRKARQEPGYAFRTWRYATAAVGVNDRTNVIMGCLDSGCVMTLIDAKLARSLNSEIHKIKPIPVSGIGSQHVSSAYVKLNLLFFGPDATAKILEHRCHQA